VPSTNDAIKSFDDLVKSDLPVYAKIRPSMMPTFESSPYFNQIRHKWVRLPLDIPSGDEVQTHRHDIAYIVKTKNFKTFFANMSYRLLPEVIYTSITIPIRMTRPTPYQAIFERAVMRVMGAGALDKAELDKRRREFFKWRSLSTRDKGGPRPLMLSSLSAVFVFWSAGCVFALIVFITELCFMKFSSCLGKKCFEEGVRALMVECTPVAVR